MSRISLNFELSCGLVAWEAKRTTYGSFGTAAELLHKPEKLKGFYDRLLYAATSGFCERESIFWYLHEKASRVHEAVYSLLRATGSLTIWDCP